MNPHDTWDRLARTARRAPEPDAAESRAWIGTVARRGMEVAALGKPSTTAVLVAWISTWKVLAPLLVLMAAGGGLVTARVVEARRPEVRYAHWSEDTLLQVRAWLPLECEEAGTIGLLLRRRVEELRAAGEGRTNVALLLRSTEDEISRLLTPEQRRQFEARQAELRWRWFPSDETR
jgi:hypothetical protein